MDVAFLPSFSTYGRALALRDFGGFALSLGVHLPRETIPVHRHQDEYQWCLTLAGGFEETAGRRQDECGAGSLLVRPPDCVHADRFTAVRGLCLNLFPRASWLAAQGFDGLRDTHVHQRSRRLLRLGGALAGELEQSDASSTLAIEGLVAEMLESAVRLDAFVRDGHPAWLAATLDEIEADPGGVLRLSTLAQSAGISAGHLARSFRAAVGRPIGAYVRERRLNRASQLLRRPDPSLSQIATTVGFYDQAHFARAFKARYGLTPAAFRAANGSAQ